MGICYVVVDVMEVVIVISIMAFRVFRGMGVVIVVEIQEEDSYEQRVVKKVVEVLNEKQAVFNINNLLFNFMHRHFFFKNLN